MIKIAPSILSADFTDIRSAVHLAEEAGADYIHCDVMDGMFVPNITFGQPMIKSLRAATKLPLDVHLMIVQPERYVDEFVDAGADIVTVHAEASNHLCRVLQAIRAKGAKAGVSLNPHTPLCVLDYIYDYIDMVLLMSVNPGFGGQKLIPAILEKTKCLKQEITRRGLPIDIEMDGGIYLDNIKTVAAAGVDIAVSGNAIFGADNPAAVIAAMKSAQ